MDASRAEKLRRLEEAIVKQRAFLHRVPDPDTREKAEAHLLKLIDMRDQLLEEPASRPQP